MKFSKGTIRGLMMFGLLVVSASIFYYIFNMTQPDVQSAPLPKPIENLSTKYYDKYSATSNDPAESSKNENNFDFAALNLTLIAAIVANPINQSSAVIQANDLVTLYKLNDKIKKTELSIAAIYHNYVVLVWDNQEYQLRLSSIQTSNLGQASTHTPEETEENAEQAAINMKLAKEIGNRPKELEHIVVITPVNDGFYVTPGINPDLFRAAKFKEGDVLQTINGKDVNIPEELAQAKALIATAETLEFNVLRGGVLVTLYLDIPAQDLSISR